VDPADVLLEHSGDSYTGRLSALIAYYSNDGFGQRQTNPTRIDVHLSQEQYARALKDGIIINADVKIDDQLRRIRAIVFDDNLRTLGSVTIPVK
jgi:hypothetical protein